MKHKQIEQIFLDELGLAIRQHGMVGCDTIAAEEAASQIMELVEAKLACYKAFIEGLEETTTGIKEDLENWTHGSVDPDEWRQMGESLPHKWAEWYADDEIEELRLELAEKEAQLAEIQKGEADENRQS